MSNGEQNLERATINIKQATELGLFQAVAQDRECVPFMLKPSYDAEELRCVKNGTSGVIVYDQSIRRDHITWRVSQIGSVTGWVNSAYLIPVSHETAGFAQRLKDAAPLATALVAVLGALASAAFWGWKQLQQRAARRQQASDLNPYFGASNTRAATQFYVPTKIQRTAPEEDNKAIAASANKIKALDWFISHLRISYKDISHKAYLLLAGSGMGKTTFLINLVLTYAQLPPRQRRDIFMLPLGNSAAREAIVTYPMHKRKGTILILDALDEDPAAFRDYKARLDDLVTAASEFRHIIVSCRTQFISKAGIENIDTPLISYGPDAGKISFEIRYISPFDDKDIEAYLGKRFKRREYRKRAQARQIVEQARQLMGRPMLLTHIHNLIEKNNVYTFNVEIYDDIVEGWFEYEVRKINDACYPARLRAFTLDLAVDLWTKRELRGGLRVHFSEINSLATARQIDLRRLTEIQISSRSLLNRTGDDRLEFAHSSLLEYFLSVVAFANPDFGQALSDSNYHLVDQVPAFVRERVLAPLPKGCRFDGSVSDFVAAFSAQTARDIRWPFVLANDQGKLAVICWTSTTPALIRTVFTLSEPLRVCLIYNSNIAVIEGLAELWAEEIKSEELLTRVELWRGYMRDAQPLKDAFVAAFSRADIQSQFKMRPI